MSKELLILRHAKSDWGAGVQTDFDRPLNQRGNKNKLQIGEFIKEKNLLPELILTSPANRAQETAKAIHGFCTDITGFQCENELYLANLETLLKYIAQLDDRLKRVMIVAHNPGLEDLVKYLLPQLLFFEMPTAGLVIIKAEIRKWRKIDRKNNYLVQFIKPRELD